MTARAFRVAHASETALPLEADIRGCLPQAAGPARFREVFATFPTGVTVVTALDGLGLPVGMTVSAVTALSLEPPQLLVCIQSGKYTLGALRDSGRFVVNILSAGQSAVSEKFAGPRFDKFRNVSWHPGFVTGAPCLEGAAAYAECVVSEVVLAGDHHIVIGTLVGGGARGGEPLVYHNRAYHRLVQELD